MIKIVEEDIYISRDPKNMQEYFGNPKTIKNLYDTLTKISEKELYPLNEQELNEFYTIYMNLAVIQKDNDNSMKKYIKEILTTLGIFD